MSTNSPPVIDALFKALTDASSDIIHLNDEQGNILYANQASERLLGYSEKELLHTPAFNIIHEEDRQIIADDMSVITLDKTLPGREIRIQKKDGRYLEVEVHGFLVPTGERRLVGAIIRDISARKSRDKQKQLLIQKKMESVGVLAGGIAHDFNNILVGILGNIELVESYTDSTNKTYPLLKDAQKALMRAKGLAQQLLTFARGDKPVTQPSSMTKIITDSADFIISGTSISCEYHIPNNLWHVNVDSGQMSQVIQNIVLNACHAMADKGTINICCQNVLDVSKELTSSPAGKYIKIIIADSGSGIPKENIDKIFDPYFSTRQGGNGLGLAICHSIICKHGGNISVQSEVNKGTIFTIYLPVSLNTLAVTSVSKSDLVKVEAECQATIMVMDDELIVREMVKQMLSHMGHEVIAVENGHEAIEIYSAYNDNKRNIDLIIMDLFIPGGLGGQETVLEILKINPKAKVIVASGYANDPVIANYQKHGFIASTTKPFQISRLNKLINTVLSEKWQTGQKL